MMRWFTMARVLAIHLMYEAHAGCPQTALAFFSFSVAQDIGAKCFRNVVYVGPEMVIKDKSTGVCAAFYSRLQLARLYG